MKRKMFVKLMFVVSVFAMMAFILPQEQKKGGSWEIPKEYKAKANAYKGDVSLEKLGKTTYSKHCRSCHGNAGLGDGVMAKNLKTFPGDFSDANFQKHTDGEVYYMSFVGRDEMPSFEKKITDEEERWAVVNYIRTLKK